MLTIVRNADARFDATVRRFFITALLALLIGAATFARAEAPPTATTEPAAPPPQATESKATTATTTITRAPSPSDELNTLLMHATFLIVGPTKVPNQISFGTVFVMGVPYKDNPKLAHIVVVTAAHVFEGINGDIATLQLRRKNPDGTYTAFGFQFPIRKDGNPLYVRHATADVAAMYADIPDEVPMTGLPPDFLVTDKSLDEIEFHPGDEAQILGFPAMVSTDGGFPFLRTGRIASYPLTPMEVVKQWAFDAHVFNGNSGGPVYFTSVNRFFKNAAHIGAARGILGLVIQERHSLLPEFANRDLDYGIVVPAKFIRETLDMLPAPPDEATGSIK
ncbi:MAG: hypothetical protein ACLP3R_24705 [Candidatus Korobacteraceae bacterium]